jgi:hypothetical protein
MPIEIKDQTITPTVATEYYPKDYTMPNYDNENPHPGFGKDPNIRNVQGHTEYPKYVTDKNGERIIVNNPTEEMEATGKGEIEDEAATAAAAAKPTKKASWGK